MTQRFRNGQQSRDGDRKTFKVMNSNELNNEKPLVQVASLLAKIMIGPTSSKITERFTGVLDMPVLLERCNI